MLAVGETLQGRYRIVREIGAGGMGTVYEGENLLIRRRVAIKVMREEVVDKPELCARFELEAQIASQIPSDHITEVLDLGELDGGRRFIVMEYLVGESLSARLERVQRVAPCELLGLVRQVLLALGAAHGAGVIHRDVKPENIFLLSEKAGRRDFVKLLDFGISKLHPVGAETPLTQSGEFMGTPSYMAPEQMGGTPPSPLSDLYAVGVILYRGLTGEAPFQSQRVHDLVYKVALGTFARPSERVAGLDPALDALVCAAMARAPEQRFQSAEQFISAIDGWLAGRGHRAPSTFPERTPQTPGGMVTTAHLATPMVESAATRPDPLRVTGALSASAQRPMVRWLGWVAAGGLIFVLVALLAMWRSQLHTEDIVTRVETLAIEPASRSAITAAAPATEAAAPPAAAPAAEAVRVRVASGSPAVTGSAAQAGSAAVVHRRSVAAATAPKPATSALRGASRAQPSRPVAAARPPLEPSSHTEDSGSKPRPDWGY